MKDADARMQDFAFVRAWVFVRGLIVVFKERNGLSMAREILRWM